MAKQVVVPGENTPPEILEQIEPVQPEPQPELSLADQVKALTAAMAVQQATIDRMSKRANKAPAVDLPTQEEAAKLARESGKGVLSKDGWIMPKVVKPAAPVVSR